MAENSRSQVTITLGRSGQVVKRAGAVFDSEPSEPIPAVGSKRSVRDRLGNSVDAVQLDYKRSRGDNGRWSTKASNCLDELHLSKDDLRFKIMKRTQNNGQQKTMDLRDILSRRAHPSMTSPVASHGRQRVPEEIRDDRRRIIPPEPRDRPREPRNERHPMLEPEPRGERQHMLQPRDDRRQRMVEPEPRDGRQYMPEPLRQGVSKTTNGSMSAQFLSMRPPPPPPPPSHMDFLRNSYSPWTLDHIRRKSPDRALNTLMRGGGGGGGLSPPPRTEQLQRRQGAYAYTSASRDVNQISTPLTTTSFMTKPSLSVGPTKSVGTLVAPSVPPGGNSMQPSQYPVEHLTVEGFLRSLGLEKYVISFKVEEVDMAALSQMGDQDLKELGIPMGPRKKILLALIARTRRQPR